MRNLSIHVNQLTFFQSLMFLHLFQGWPMYAQLLIDLFKYLAPFLRNVELNKPMQILYKVQYNMLCWWSLPKSFHFCTYLVMDDGPGNGVMS